MTYRNQIIIDLTGPEEKVYTYTPNNMETPNKRPRTKKQTVQPPQEEETIIERYDEYDDNLLYYKEGYVSVYSGMLYKTLEEYDNECKGRKYFSQRKGYVTERKGDQ